MKKIQLFLVMLLATCLSVAAQDTKVTGKITDADGEAVIGATVKVEGTNVYAISDIEGAYAITIPSGAKKVLVITFTGYKTVTLPINQSGNYDVVMEESDILIGGQEGLVVVGYGSPRRAGTVVGSSTKVESKEFESRPTTSAFDALQGKVPGLQIFTSSGEPGTMQSVRLHGVGSINSSTAPLYVIDGMPVSVTAVQAMNPNDIESTTVLKDASATSIYGSRASNGVIYISTKRGSSGQKAVVTLDASMGINEISNMDYYDQLMHTDELFRFWDETSMTDTRAIKRELLAQNIIDPNTGSFWDTRWIKHQQPANNFNNVSLSIRGGSAVTNYYISASHTHDGGTPLQTYFDRTNVRSNINAQVNDWMKIGMNLNVGMTEQVTNPNYNGNYTYGGLQYLWAPYYSPYSYDMSQPDIYEGLGYQNVNYYMRNSPRRYRDYITTGSAYMELEPIKNLKFRSQVGLDVYWTNNMAITMEKVREGDGTYSRAKGKYSTLNIINTVEYSHVFGNKHTVTALLGQEGIKRSSESMSYYEAGRPDDRIIEAGKGKQDTRTIGSSYSDSRMLSFFGRVGYDYENKYFAEVSFRNDKSSKFSPHHNQKNFWSVGARWNMKEEKWLKDVTMLDYLSFNVSYGTQGNDGIGGDFNSWRTMGTSKYAGLAAWGPAGPGNPELTWETQSKLTVGIETMLWSKLGIAVEFYRRTTNDLIMDVPIPYTTGFRQYMANVGSLRNTGVDFEINYTPLRGRDYFLSFNLNASYNQQKITELFDGRDHWYVGGTSVGYTVGQPIQFYLPIAAGINPDNGAPQWYLPGQNIANRTTDNGTIDLATGTYNEETLTQNTGKSMYAPWSGGFGIQGSWKGIGVAVDFVFALGKYTLSNNMYFLHNPTQNIGMNTTSYVWDYWKNPGDVVEYPDWKNYSLTNVFDTRLLFPASFMRLKNVTVSYDFKKEWLKKTGFLEGAQIYFKGRNLWTLTHSAFRDIDPEVDRNLALGNVINPRAYSIGVKLTF